MSDKLIITPKTKIGELLKIYPELEEPLIEIAPAFKKLKNPVLRKTIAKITSIEQAAAVAELGVDKIVNRLREIVGQQDILIEKQDNVEDNGKPAWISESGIVHKHDARSEIAGGGHPLGAVMGKLPEMNNGAIYLLITPFYPAPLIDKVSELGFRTWTEKKDDDLFNNYFCKE